jgi:hypothetical protein
VVTGTIRTDGTRLANADTMRVIAQPLSGRTGTGQMAAPVAGGGFTFDGLIGPYTFTADRLPAGWVVKSVLANGADVTDGQIEFRGAEQVDLQILLTDRLSELYGTVRADGRVVPRASVLVFPEDAARWTGASRSIRTTRTDRNGNFAIRALVPDQRYLAIAVEYLNDGDDQDPEFLQQMKSRAVIVPASSELNRLTDLTLVTR